MKLHKTSRQIRHKKCKILLDENLPSRAKFPRLNGRYIVRHIVHDFNRSGITDKEIFDIAEKEEYIIVTLNEKDFSEKKRITSGLIGVSPHMSVDEIDKKLTSLLTSHKECFLIGKFHHLSNSKTK